jgi:hypothetical protein
MDVLKNLPLFILIALLFVACDSDDKDGQVQPSLEELAEAHIVTEGGFDCSEYRFIDFIENDESINFLEVIGNVIYYVNFDNQIKAYSIASGSTQLLAETNYVAEVERNGETVNFCTWSGIFSVEGGDIGSFRKISEYSCQSLEQTEDKNRYFTGFNNKAELSNTTADHIYKIVSIDSVVQVTIDQEEWISTFEMLRNNEIIAFNSGNTDAIYHYNSAGEIINIFNSSNSGLNVGHYEADIWTFTDDDRVVAVLKNGLGFPDILEWDHVSSAWYDYIDEDLFDFDEAQDQWKLSDFTAPAYSDIIFKDGFLYVATTLSGCRGVQKIDLNTVGENLGIEDITIIKDSKLDDIGDCLQGIHFDEVMKRFIVYSQKGLVILSSCN